MRSRNIISKDCTSGWQSEAELVTTRAKTAEEHVRIALEFLEHSDREFAAGDAPQGSEKL